ncbi:MAG: nucleotidyltransferase family protein [Candidatus Eremiobacteraeota bacterium]|nr:nucleotidyltransferase family protein [Candidatus Eremiobacteraeota bacterium]
MKYNAFITAGGLISGKFAQMTGTEIKALIKIDGKSLLQRAVYALRESGVISRIALVAPEEMRGTPEVRGVDDFIPADKSGVENILRGLRNFKDDKHVVLCTSDLPFINANAVKDFIERCPEDAAVCYPIFERDEINPSIRPGVPSYIKLRDGHFTGGSIFRLDTAVCLLGIDEIGKSFRKRKSALGMASLLGWRFVLELLLGRAKLESLIKRAGEIIGGKCVAVRGCDPVITMDIDDEKSYLFSLELSKSRQI